MEQLKLLFTKDGVQYQILRNKTVSVEQSFFKDEESPENFLKEKLDEILANKSFKEITNITKNYSSHIPISFIFLEMVSIKSLDSACSDNNSR